MTVNDWPLGASALARAARTVHVDRLTTLDDLVTAIYHVGASLREALDQQAEVARSDARREFRTAEAISTLREALIDEGATDTLRDALDEIALRLREIDTTIGARR